MLFNLRAIIFLFLFIFGLLSSSAQNVDSLLVEFENNYRQLNDQDKFKLLEPLTGQPIELEKKIEILEQFIKLTEKMDSVKLNIFAHSTLAYSLGQRGELVKATEILYEQIKRAKAEGFIIMAADASANLASILRKQENPRDAIKLEKDAISLLMGEGPDKYRSRIGGIYLNLGNSYYDVGEYDSAILVLNKSLQYKPFPMLRAYVDATKSLAFAGKGNFDSAAILLQKATNTLSEVKVQYAIADTYIQYARSNLRFQRLDSAEFYGRQGYQLAKKSQVLETIKDGAKVLSDIYEDRSLLDSAFLYQKEYYLLRDSLENIEDVKKTAALRREFEVSQKQAEVDLLASQKRNQQIISLAVSLFLLLSITASILIYRNYKQKNELVRELAIQKEELQQLNTTKDRFFSIISHDLRGPIHAFHGISRMIRTMVQTKNTHHLMDLSDEIDRSVYSVTGLLDNLLNWAVQQQKGIPHNPELLEIKPLFQDLIGVFKSTAEAKDIRLDLDADEKVVVFADKNTFSTAMRNLISNAIKFTNHGGTVSVRAKSAGESLTIEVSDTGVGIPDAKKKVLFNLNDRNSTYGTHGEKGVGLGLQLVQDFIKLNNGSIEVESKVNVGTTFVAKFSIAETSYVMEI
jgi:signal transduction histidine kinase